MGCHLSLTTHGELASQPAMQWIMTASICECIDCCINNVFPILIEWWLCLFVCLFVCLMGNWFSISERNKSPSRLRYILTPGHVIRILSDALNPPSYV